MRKFLTGGLAWAGVLTVAAACLGPVWKDWSGSVVAPFGGIDAMLQLGILEWTARHWTQPSLWIDLPIFHPVPGALGFMDSLLGQAWLVAAGAPAVLNPTLAGLYNWAFLGSLLLAIARRRRSLAGHRRGVLDRRAYLPWPWWARPTPRPRSAT